MSADHSVTILELGPAPAGNTCQMREPDRRWIRCEEPAVVVVQLRPAERVYYAADGSGPAIRIEICERHRAALPTILPAWASRIQELYDRDYG